MSSRGVQKFSGQRCVPGDTVRIDIYSTLSLRYREINSPANVFSVSLSLPAPSREVRRRLCGSFGCIRSAISGRGCHTSLVRVWSGEIRLAAGSTWRPRNPADGRLDRSSHRRTGDDVVCRPFPSGRAGHLPGDNPLRQVAIDGGNTNSCDRSSGGAMQLRRCRERLRMLGQEFRVWRVPRSLGLQLALDRSGMCHSGQEREQIAYP